MPKSWTEAVGVCEGLYHFPAVSVGALAGLATVIVLGLYNTVASNLLGHYDYREGVSIWFRGIFRCSLHPT